MKKIINILKEKKSIPLDKFIDIALYDKKIGYYMKKNPFGRDGDFITSPLISNLFGEMIAIWCVAFWEHVGKPNKILLVELGPGDGSLCKNLLETFIDELESTYRELGISDNTFSKKMKIAAKSMYGRLSIYSNTINDRKSFDEALLRNIWPLDKELTNKVHKLSEYVYKKIHKYNNKSYKDIIEESKREF